MQLMGLLKQKDPLSLWALIGANLIPVIGIFLFGFVASAG